MICTKQTEKWRHTEVGKLHKVIDTLIRVRTRG